MTLNVVSTSPGFGRAGDLPSRLAAAGWALTYPDASSLPDHLARADFLIAGLPPVTAATLDAAPRLRGVLKHGVGLDSIDLAACTARGVPVTSTPGANAVAVAELALAAVFALSRNIVGGHASVTTGGWHRRIGRDVEGATLGIVGFGAIGQCLAGKARALGMQVLASDPFPNHAAADRLGVVLRSLPDLLAASDHVSLHVMGGPATVGLIGADQLALMRSGATLLNMARGEVVDLDALAQALHSGRLGGAAIDAFAQEPPDLRHPIFAAPNVIFSPHSGADTTGALIRTGAMVIEDLTMLIAGGHPARCANPAVFANQKAQK